VEGWFFATAALLVVSGSQKLIDGAPTAGALKAAGLPHARPWVVLVAVTEIGIGATNLLASNPGAVWAQAALYAAFGVFVASALIRRLPLASCGCFGKADTPPTWMHLVINVLAVAGAVRQASSSSALWSVLSDQPLAGLPYLGFVGLATYCLYLLLGDLPSLRTRA